MTRSGRGRAPLYIAVGLLALAGGIAAWMWPSIGITLGSHAPSPPAPRQPPDSTTAESRAAEEASAASATTITPTRPATPASGQTPAVTPTVAPPALTSLGKSAAEEYRRRARYPHSSQPLGDGEDPILRAREVSPVTATGPEGAEPVLTVFPERVSFESPSPVHVYAFLSVKGERVPAQRIVGEVQTDALEVVGALAFRDDGIAPDAVAGDAVYSAPFDPGEAAAQRLAASYLVRVQAVTESGDRREAATGFLYSRPQAHLTGRYRDALIDGDLAVDAEVEVAANGRFHIEGSLYAEDGRPLAWAQTTEALPPGLQWMRLPFFGLILRERQVDGPYVLRYVALSTTTQMPNAKNDLVENAYVTASYAAAAFRDQPFNDPNLLEAADRLERDARTAFRGGE